MPSSAHHSIIAIEPLGSLWTTIDPFLVCAHHVDHYPRGKADLGPEQPADNRPPGDGMGGKHGWRMYFGDPVPGFPAHPHRGFETITILRKGFVDHADSLGASARFGAGDVQWLTAGRGIVHAEMFPLLERDKPNPFELFQIWLNLPARSKMAAPDFKMFWAEDIPRLTIGDGGATEVLCIVGMPDSAGGSAAPPLAPADSWAADPAADVAIWTITMAAGARWSLPPARGNQTRRQLFYFKGSGLRLNDSLVPAHTAIEVEASHAIAMVNGDEPAEVLMLQGRPIGEPVVQSGPFVMNTASEIEQAYRDYRQTQFGAWPWPESGPVHGSEPRRFANR